jgi:hypothetical protein
MAASNAKTIGRPKEFVKLIVEIDNICDPN